MKISAKCNNNYIAKIFLSFWKEWNVKVEKQDRVLGSILLNFFTPFVYVSEAKWLELKFAVPEKLFGVGNVLELFMQMKK